LRTEKPQFKPCALGEIAIRCAVMAEMVRFYEDIVGLERSGGEPDSTLTFFRIDEGFGGHTATLALFDAETSARPREEHSGPLAGPGSSLHHIAPSLPFSEQDTVMRWYDSLNQPCTVEDFGWVGWPRIFTHDPEGNTVKMVAYDASLLDA